MFERIKEAREEFEVVYLGSSRFRWALGLTIYGPWLLVAVGYLLTINNTDHSPYAALSNAVTSGIRQFLPILAMAAMIKFSLRTAAIFRQEKRRLYGLR